MRRSNDRKRVRGLRAMSARTAHKFGSAIADEVIAGLEDAVAVLRAGKPLASRLTVRSYRIDARPSEYGAAQVRAVRASLGLSQPLFAVFLGVEPATLRSWEQGKRSPSALARRFLDEIRLNPDYFRQRLGSMATAVMGDSGV